MRKRIVFIINPISGTRHSDDIESIVRKELSADVFDIVFRYTEHQGHGGEIATEAVRNGVDIVGLPPTHSHQPEEIHQDYQQPECH